MTRRNDRYEKFTSQDEIFYCEMVQRKCAEKCDSNVDDVVLAVRKSPSKSKGGSKSMPYSLGGARAGVAARTGSSTAASAARDPAPYQGGSGGRSKLLRPLSAAGGADKHRVGAGDGATGTHAVRHRSNGSMAEPNVSNAKAEIEARVKAKVRTGGPASSSNRRGSAGGRSKSGSGGGGSDGGRVTKRKAISDSNDDDDGGTPVVKKKAKVSLPVLDASKDANVDTDDSDHPDNPDDTEDSDEDDVPLAVRQERLKLAQKAQCLAVPAEDDDTLANIADRIRKEFEGYEDVTAKLLLIMNSNIPGLTMRSKLMAGTNIVYDDKAFECEFCGEFDSSVKEMVEAHEATCLQNPNPNLNYVPTKSNSKPNPAEDETKDENKQSFVAERWTQDERGQSSW